MVPNPTSTEKNNLDLQRSVSRSGRYPIYALRMQNKLGREADNLQTVEGKERRNKREMKSGNTRYK